MKVGPRWVEASNAFTDKPVRKIAIEVQHANGWNTCNFKGPLFPHCLYESFRTESSLGRNPVTQERQIDTVYFQARESSASFYLLAIPKVIIAVSFYVFTVLREGRNLFLDVCVDN